MTCADRGAITSPTEGLVVYNKTFKCLSLYNGTAWQKIGISNVTKVTTEDTYITAGGTNYGTFDEVWVKGTGSQSQKRFGFFKFNSFSDCSLDSVGNAEITLTVLANGGGSSTFTMFEVADPASWDETSSSNNTPAPTGSALLTFDQTTPVGTKLTVDITSVVNAAITAGKTSVAFTITGTGSTLLKIGSKEHATESNRPIIKITL